MFSVIFKVHAKSERRDAYLAVAGALRPHVQQIVGFNDNIRYRSLTRDGWILSLSSWANEKALIRWRTMLKHHEAQERGRTELLRDYHLRVGQKTRDTYLIVDRGICQDQLEETEVGFGTSVTLVGHAAV